MSVRKMVNRDAVGVAAMMLIEMSGVEALSMRSLANALGIKAPSLYDHVKNRDEVLALVQAEGLRRFGVGFSQVGQSTREKVLFYRTWALTNSKLYPVVFQQTLHRDLLPQGLEESILGLVVEAAGGSHIAARVMWAQLHGLVDLELQGRLPADADLDKTWDQVVIAIDALKRSSATS
jgi:AcrR family transcriptional regulator